MNLYNQFGNQEELNEILLRKSLVGNFIIQDEKFVYFNESVENITGYNFEELLNLNPFELVHQEDREIVYQKYIVRVNGIEDDETYSFRLIRKDGDLRWITARAFGVIYRGKPAVAVNAMDTTPMIKLGEELKKKNELLKHLSSLLRHDLLNDLTIISAALELRDEELLERALERVSSMEEKISDVKKLEDEMGELKTLNVADLAYSVVEKYKRDANINFHSEKVLARVDESLKSAIENIIGNAIIHNPSHVDIEVEVFRDREECVIKISDNGVGISDELKEKIFKERVSTRKGGGLGLLITKRIVNIFEGSIRVYDNAPKGVVFELRIPCIQQQ
ncbi:MAG: ATP-binding protein [Archaeoglobaceae archaeon]